MGDDKPFYLSRTLWVNAIVAVLGMVNSDTVSEHPDAAVGFIAIVNLVLRIVTKGRVTLG